ncbi:ABC transporter ATP-binding protein [Microbispora rosea]|uniref:ABC transporter ATP-binding protein n=1 Tax=Microbispora rosea TaxID=58117 RepID=UPI0037ACD9A7
MPSDDSVLRVRDVRKSYRGGPVLRGVDLDLPPGRVVGIVGENGAGKTTLLRVLAGDLRPDGGSVRHGGRIGHCPQETVLHDAFTVEQHLRFFQVAYGLESLRRAEELMEALRFSGSRRARPGTLSGGTRQKLNLVLALMHDPDVLLLDEPYQGFDWETYVRFWDLAEELRGRGRSVLVVSHLAYDAARLDMLHRLEGGVLREQERVGVATGEGAGDRAGAP